MASFSSEPKLPHQFTICEFGYADQKTPTGRSTLLVSALQREGFRISSLLVNPLSRAKSIQLAVNVWRSSHARFVFLRFPYFPWMIQCAVFLKRRLKARLVVDAMISAYETIIEDRRLYQAGSKQANSCKQEDLLVGREADLLVVDTHLHAEFLVRKFGWAESKIIVVPVGSPLVELSGRKETGQDRPRHEGPTIAYVGNFIPLHGVGTIIEAARMISSEGHNTQFRFIGEGQDYERARKLAAKIDGIKFLGSLSREEALQEIRQADIVLGIFGSSIKSRLVVPFKVYDAFACGKPVITARTPAAEASLRHGEDCWLVAPEPAALARGIEQLVSDPSLRRKLGIGARKSYETHFHSSVAIKPLAQKLNELAVTQPLS
jgi:glycosyltransferase involved in cell wall biosynthesis